MSRNASRGLNHGAPTTNAGPGSGDDVDYWYRLGLRNAYAQAAGLCLARELAEDPFAIAERITASLDAGVTDVTALHSAAYGHAARATAERQLDWIGPKEFAARHGVVGTADHHFGARWGARGEQRITLRPNPAGGRGLLFVYDPTWDEYAVLATDVLPAAVEAAFAHAGQVDIHLEPVRFAELVHAHEADAAPARTVTALDVGMQL